MNSTKIKQYLEEIGEPKFRWQQIKKAIYQDGALSFTQITTLSKALREKLDAELKILSLEPEQILVANDKKSIKALLETGDGEKIETVLIKMGDDKWSACISAQVGCVLGCRFCATGQMGFKRNLSAEEISDQVLFWLGWLRSEKPGDKLSNVIYMGMGEPFLNWVEVRLSLQNLLDENKFNLAARSISVSTAGIPEGIKNLSREFPQVNLAISLHTVDNKKRDELMVINRRFDLKSLKRALENYLERTNRKVFLEYVMLDKVNDSPKDASLLIDFVNDFEKKHLLHVNLIAYNDTGTDYRSTSPEKINTFKNLLTRAGVSVTIRKSVGQEIVGACGQLSSRNA